MSINTGLTVDELLTEIQDRLGVSDFTRYSAAKILRSLNEKQRYFAERTRCLKGTAILPLKADVPAYALPTSLALADGIEQARFYSSTTEYDDLELHTIAYMDSHYPGWKTATSGTPEILVAGDWQGRVQKFFVYPPASTTGTAYASGTDAGVRVGQDSVPTSALRITGTATGGSTTTLQDTTVDFTKMGLVVGQPVVKTYGATHPVTAGSEPIGYISVIATTQLTFAVAMTESGQFDATDTYLIVAGEFTVAPAVEQIKETYIFSADFASIIPDITIPANNIVLEFSRYPISLTYTAGVSNNQVPDIPWSWHHALADGAAGEILLRDTDRNGKRDQALAAKMLSSFEVAILRARAATTPFKNQETRVAVRVSR